MSAMTFGRFWIAYRRAHVNRLCFAAHAAGAVGFGFWFLLMIADGAWGWLWVPPALLYTSAWLGHWVFAKNSPMTFDFKDTWLAPIYSMACFWLMMAEACSGRFPWTGGGR